MKNLGKIVALFFLIQSALLGSVQASLDSNVAYSGEVVTYQLTMSGNDIEKPTITDICGNDIVATSSQTSIESVNGSYSRKYTLSYQFMPTKSCVISPKEVKVDGKIEKSNSVSLTLKKASEDVNAEFMLSLDTPKKELYVGEPFELTLLVKQKRNAQAVDSKFLVPDFQGFWKKSESKPTRSDDGTFITTKVLFTLAAQRDGNLTITPAQLQIASRDNKRDMWGSFSPNIKWRNYFSNELHIDAKPVPNAATLIGDFTLGITADKKEINPNEAVNVTIEVLGRGNLEDVKSFKPYLNNVNVFDEKILIDANRLTQKLVFVSDMNFTIPSFTLSYFNTKTQRVEQIKTKEIPVTVRNSSPQGTLKVTRDESQNTPELSTPKQERVKESVVDKVSVVVAFIIGLLLGVVIMLLKPLKFFSKEKGLDVKDEKVLLMKLLPYKEDAQVAKIADMLEKNLYSSQKEKIDKKVLKEIIKKYNIS